MTDNPITAWLATLGDLPTDPVKRALTIALKAVEVWELALERIECTGLSYGPQTTLRVSMQETKIATTEALFPPSSVDAQAPTERVSDERLEHLGRELRRLEMVEGTSIIPSLWNPGEIYSIVEEVMRARAAPVPEWFVENLREKQRLCGAAMQKNEGLHAGDLAEAQSQLLDELLQQAVEAKP